MTKYTPAFETFWAKHYPDATDEVKRIAWDAWRIGREKMYEEEVIPLKAKAA